MNFIRIQDSQVEKTDKGKYMLFSPSTGSFFELNDTMFHVWTHLENPISKQELVDILMDEFAVDQLEAEEDIENVIRELKENNLIKEI